MISMVREEECPSPFDSSGLQSIGLERRFERACSLPLERKEEGYLMLVLRSRDDLE